MTRHDHRQRRTRLALAAACAATLPALAPPAATAADPCPNAAVRQQQNAQHLPDCRAFEQVSPASKSGYQVGNNEYPSSQVLISADGSRVTYATLYAVTGISGAQSGHAATRTSTGWINRGLTPPNGPVQDANDFPGFDTPMRGSTPDGRTSFYWDNTTLPFASLWVVRPDGSRQRIATGVDKGAGQRPFGQYPGHLWYAGTSHDGRHVVFASSARIGPAAGLLGSEDILYEWVDDGAAGGAGTLRVVSRTDAPVLELIDEASPAELGGSVADEYARTAGASSTYATAGMRNAVSADGRRIFFQNPAPGMDADVRPAGGGPLYLREDGTRTVELSLPAPGHTPAAAPTRVQWLDAAADGSRAFFWADGDLTDDAAPAGGIYVYDVGARQLAFLAPTTSLSRVPTALASDDGSQLYYEDETGLRLHRPGEDRLVLAGSRVASGLPTGNGILSNPGGLHADRCVSATVSPSGRYLAFTSGMEDRLEVYRYDAAGAGTLTRVSTSPTAPAVTDSSFATAGACAQRFPRPIEVRAMSDDGRFVFFATAAALDPADTNDDFDVYRWSADDGQPRLISPGTGPGDTLFAGTDATGASAMLYSEERLAPSDGDGVYDIYDARIGGGFLATPAPDCRADACQGPPPEAPSPAVAGSESFSGDGNARDAAPVCRTERRQLGVAKRRLRAAAKKLRRVRRAARVGRARATAKARRVATRRVRTAERQVRRARAQVRATRARLSRCTTRSGS